MNITKTLLKAPVYTTEMLYNTQAKPKTKFTETDFQPLNIEWKFDWSQYGSYDETDQLNNCAKYVTYRLIRLYQRMIFLIVKIKNGLRKACLPKHLNLGY